MRLAPEAPGCERLPMWQPGDHTKTNFRELPPKGQALSLLSEMMEDQMSRTPNLFQGILLAATLLLPCGARADQASTASESKSWAERNIKATYLNWLSGMHTEALSGNRDGKIGRAHV